MFRVYSFWNIGQFNIVAFFFYKIIFDKVWLYQLPPNLELKYNHDSSYISMTLWNEKSILNGRLASFSNDWEHKSDHTMKK